MPTLEPAELIINEDASITGMHNGSVAVNDAELSVRGMLNGSVRVTGGRVVVERAGMVNGSMALHGGAVVEVRGGLYGSVHVEEGSHLLVASGATVAGAMHNSGQVTVEGRIAGTHSGRPVEMLPGSRRVAPRISPDGVHHYDL